MAVLLDPVKLVPFQQSRTYLLATGGLLDPHVSVVVSEPTVEEDEESVRLWHWALEPPPPVVTLIGWEHAGTVEVSVLTRHVAFQFPVVAYVQVAVGLAESNVWPFPQSMR